MLFKCCEEGCTETTEAKNIDELWDKGWTISVFGDEKYTACPSHGGEVFE
ncbi:MAG: hypothetical protein UT48_C0007G0032 [Parcubacteria group bacterium GW2011_GWE2_39_37]|uniref:Uncharacterized protein n=1 Tax=Candidatus Falkowbacteria bacterium GW2011_GWF2_39_8 TaxID=1618642 RepID=A0A0G0T723_9BACT|nr:MAG: hypothetical protein UT48_C0007G0032 [Parcubacteria group bacterium GW2011_GWE2_39_37]KKR33627.1 MAG: hypothetical protein UT64_C0005G0007 [Candidatus Falkowbacteria bacterium GW2011_GWF2_39_8]